MTVLFGTIPGMETANKTLQEMVLHFSLASKRNLQDHKLTVNIKRS